MKNDLERRMRPNSSSDFTLFGTLMVYVPKTLPSISAAHDRNAA